MSDEPPGPPPRTALRFVEDELAALREAGLLRRVRPLASAPGPTVQVEGRELLLLCSNNYLGLASDPRLTQAAAEAALRWGTGSGASRLVTGALPLHDELEQRLARLKGTADCVLFGSGYLANLGTIAALVERGDTVVSDQLNHASIIDGCRLSGAAIGVYPHADAAACEALVAEARARGSRRILVVTDSVFSMDGDTAPLADLVALTGRHDAMLMVDEAHATGVLGAGAIARAGLEGQVEVVMGTCSKALGSLGGFVAGSQSLCDYLRNRARSFIFDTALPPAVVAASLAALDILEADADGLGARVCAHAHRLYQGLRALGYDARPPSAAIVPVLLGEAAAAVAAAEALRRRGVLALPIRPPTVPPGTARLRLCAMATHTDAHIDQALAAFAAIRGEIG